MSKKHPTIERLQELFSLSLEDGLLRWRQCRPNRPIGSVAGYVRKDGYRLVTIDGKRHIAGRVVWALTHGKWPEGEIGHINGNRSDDRPANLIDASRSVHHSNIVRPRRGSVTGLAGVQRRTDGRYGAQYKDRFIGSYETPAEAARAKWQFKMEQGLVYRPQSMLPVNLEAKP